MQTPDASMLCNMIDQDVLDKAVSVLLLLGQLRPPRKEMEDGTFVAINRDKRHCTYICIYIFLLFSFSVVVVVVVVVAPVSAA